MRTMIAASAATVSFLLTGYVAASLVPVSHSSQEEFASVPEEAPETQVFISDVDTAEIVIPPPPLIEVIEPVALLPAPQTEALSEEQATDVPLETKAIHIYLGTQTAELLEDGVIVKTYQISSGKSSTPTPTGDFMIHRKQDLRISGQAVPYRMPNYMSFTKNGAFGLHGLPYLGSDKESSTYWQEARDHIGVPVSHGCVRFLPEEAEEIYEWVNVGVPVVIRI